MGTNALAVVALLLGLGADAGTGADGGAPAPAVDWEKTLVGTWSCKGVRGVGEQGFFRAALTVTRALDGMYLAVEWKQEMVNGKPPPATAQTVGHWWRERDGSWGRYDLDAARKGHQFTGTAEGNLLVWKDPARARRDTLELGPTGLLRGKLEGELAPGTWRPVGRFECQKRTPAAPVTR